MLPANMFAAVYRNKGYRPAFPAPSPGAVPISSRCSLISGSAGRQFGSPFFRYEVSTVALRLSSPVIRHSKPKEASVGGSAVNSPAVVEVCANSALANSRPSVIGIALCPIIIPTL